MPKQAPGELVFTGPVPFGNGQTLHDLLVEAVAAEPNIETFFGHRVERLLRDDGRVCGLVCSENGSEVTFDAGRGVVLACGGFEQDQEMILNHLKAYPSISALRPTPATASGWRGGRR